MQDTFDREHNVQTSHTAATCAEAKNARSPSEAQSARALACERESERERERDRASKKKREEEEERERERARARARGSERGKEAHLGHDVIKKLEDDAASRLAVNCAVEKHLGVSGCCRGRKGPRPP